MAGKAALGVLAAAVAALVAVGPSAARDACGALPEVLGESADSAQIRCALTRAREASQTRAITINEVKPAVEAAPFAIEFEFGSARVTPRSAELLARVAGVIAADDALRGAAYFIDGHTDAVGSDAANEELGRARAAAAAAHLLSAVDFALVVKVRSFGERQLLDAENPNSARNRRVEITPVALE
ncbi:OmpA family protein [Roseovarius spongiae]|uniref:OmpA family protein n=1 Tax=Roseovarius spongiae TaxID=2320272 RepID=A0A3A8B8D1_9RHOB|nr:OmpA family protein [Roseovarius spongiae]RKF13828.1 OmpA family protein [Roseovarius spongiae]